MIRAGAQAVKLEGGRARLPVIEAIIRAEIPVMGHLGLTPQSVLAMGGFKVQARNIAAADALLDAAKSLEAAGCFAFVIEGVPDVVGAAVTEAIGVPDHRHRRRPRLRRPGHGLPRPARPRAPTPRPSSCASTPRWGGSPPRPSPPSPTTCAAGAFPSDAESYHGSAELGEAPEPDRRSAIRLRGVRAALVPQERRRKQRPGSTSMNARNRPCP